VVVCDGGRFLRQARLEQRLGFAEIFVEQVFDAQGNDQIRGEVLFQGKIRDDIALAPKLPSSFSGKSSMPLSLRLPVKFLFRRNASPVDQVRVGARGIRSRVSRA